MPVITRLLQSIFSFMMTQVSPFPGRLQLIETGKLQNCTGISTLFRRGKIQTLKSNKTG
jgi:hypothetical protein